METNFIIAGFGGQGVLLAGTVLANAFMLEDKNVTWYPCYGAEMRGGTVNCEIVVSDTEVSSVHKQNTNYALVLNQQSFDKYISKIVSGGTIVANSSLVEQSYPRNDIKYAYAPISQIANNLGNNKVTNIVALGILASICDSLSDKYIINAIENLLSTKKKDIIPLNIQAYNAGKSALLTI